MKKIALPDILKKDIGKVLSLDIGGHTFKIAYLAVTKGKAKLLKYEIKTLGPEVAQNEKKALTEFVNAFISNNSIVEKNIVISLQHTDALVVRRVNLPSVPEKEIKDALKWEVKDEAPFDLDQAQIDWQVIGEYTDKEGAKRKDILWACAKKDLINKYVEIVKDIGLNVLDIKSPPFNFAHILKEIDISKKASVAVLDMGGSCSTFSVYKEGNLTFLREMPCSSEQLTASMSGTLVSDKGKIELTKEKAESIKKEFGIPQDLNQILKDDIKGSQVISMIRPCLERLISESKRSIDYYVSSFEAEPPKILYLTGGGSNLKGLAEYLNKELGLNVAKLPLPEAMTVGEGIDKQSLEKDTTQLTSSVSAVFGIGKRPSLLPQEHKAEKVEALEKISLRLIGIAIGFIFLFSLFMARVQVGDYKKRVKNAKLYLETVDEIGDLNNKIIERRTLAEDIKSDEIPADWVLKELASLMPDSGVLEKLILDQRE